MCINRKHFNISVLQGLKAGPNNNRRRKRMRLQENYEMMIAEIGILQIINLLGRD